MRTKQWTISLVLGLILISQCNTVRGDTNNWANNTLSFTPYQTLIFKPTQEVAGQRMVINADGDLNWIPLLRPVLDSELYLMLQGAEHIKHSA